MTSAGGRFFNGSTNLDGVDAGSTIVIKDVHFVGDPTGATQSGYALITPVNPKVAGKITIVLEGCTFENMWCAVYGNNISDDDTADISITIKDCTYINTPNGYSIENVSDNRDHFTVVFTGNTGYDRESEFGN